MRIKFLETVPSSVAEYPFTAGQIVPASAISDVDRRRLLREGRIALIEDATEQAVLAEPSETATTTRGKGRGRR